MLRLMHQLLPGTTYLHFVSVRLAMANSMFAVLLRRFASGLVCILTKVDESNLLSGGKGMLQDLSHECHHVKSQWPGSHLDLYADSRD